MYITFDQVGSFILKQRRPIDVETPRLMLLLHGWTGDESSMMIFTAKLPQAAWLVAPRGLHPAPQGGYSWYPPSNRISWPNLDIFRPSVQSLLELMTPENFPGACLEQLDLVGFSQGAALAYAFALLHPQRVRAVAGMAGFLPDGVATFLGNDKPLLGKPIFVTHGSRDTIIPVDFARRGVEFLQQAGADVMYCEDDVGHKLSAGCFASLEAFWQRLL